MSSNLRSFARPSRGPHIVSFCLFLASAVLLIGPTGTANAQANDEKKPEIEISEDGVRIGSGIAIGRNGVSLGRNGIQIGGPDIGSNDSGAVWRDDIYGGDYVGADFSGYRFAGPDIIGADFTDADFSGAEFSGVDFRDVILTGANFADAEFGGVNFINVFARDACFTNVKMAASDFVGGDISRSNFTGAKLVNNTFAGTIQEGVIRSGVPTCMNTKANVVRASSEIAAELGQGTGAQVTLQVNFETDSDQLRSDARVQVFEIAKALNSEPALMQQKIRVEGHTDSDGDSEYNRDLSVRRALTVVRELTEIYNVDAARLEVAGFGEDRPVASNAIEFGKSENRRVVLVNIGPM